MEINVHKLYTLDGHRDCVYGLEGSHSNSIFYSAAGDGMIVEWDLHAPETGKLLAQMKNSVYSIHFRKDKNLLIAGQNYEGIHLIDAKSKSELGSLEISDSQLFDIKSHKEKIFVGSGDGTLYVIDFDNLALIKKIKLSDKSIRSLAVNEQLGEIAVGLSDNSIRILDLDNYVQKYRINAHKLSVFSVIYNPTNNHLISASRDAHLKSWNSLEHYSLVHSIPAHMYAINSISISPDRELFVTGSMDKSVKVWKMDTFQLLKVIDRSRHAGHATSVNKVLWTDFGNQILSCSDDKKISVWDLSYI
ncbi:MAG: WD40 repeat domain-containing protein [Cytophagales bacterium]|nr:WD40 repeat domain-containing protein [Cytophagales bacterium]